MNGSGTPQPDSSALFALSDKLRLLRERQASHAAELEAINKEVKAAERELSDAMATAECPSFTRDGKMFVMTTTSFWSAADDRTEDLYAALREKGHDSLFTVNVGSLGKFIRAEIAETADENGETHIPDWLCGLVKSYDRIGITIRKAATKTKK
jgi:hypothetical protein